MQREERKVSSLHRERRARPLRKKKKEAKRSSMQQTIRSSAVDHSTRTSGRLREDSLEDESGGGEKRHLFLVTFFFFPHSRVSRALKKNELQRMTIQKWAQGAPTYSPSIKYDAGNRIDVETVKLLLPSTHQHTHQFHVILAQLPRLRHCPRRHLLGRIRVGL